MNNKFTVKESNLICVFQNNSRTEVIKSISMALKQINDEDMIDLSLQVLRKLENMTDKEFAILKLEVAE